MIFEEKKPLSKSFLWDWQTAAYADYGPEAWSEKGVPFYLTSNPSTANRYANVVLAYLKDAEKNLDFQAPFYLFELGAGSGRLAFHFLREWNNLVAGTRFEKLDLRYVGCDITEKTFAFWKKQPQLSQEIEKGNFFAATYFWNQQGSIELFYTREKIDKENLVNPIAVFANYLFDTVPHDLFRFTGEGELEEGLISLSLPEAMTLTEALKSQEFINQLSYEFTFEPVSQDLYAAKPYWKELVESYRRELSNVPFYFPTAALEIIDYFSELSDGKMLLLAGDQGEADLRQLKERTDPRLARHHTFSIAVNYHAIQRYFEILGGKAFLPPFPDNVFVVLCGVLGLETFPETAIAYREKIAYFEPQDYWRLVNVMERKADDMSLEELLSCVKIGMNDPLAINYTIEPLKKKFTEATPWQASLWIQMLREVEKKVYPLGRNEAHFLINLGVLAFHLKAYEDSIDFFKKALYYKDEEKLIFSNIAACYQALDRPFMARQFSKQAESLP